jgi:predicted nucleic acid-binding protein
MQQYIIDSGVIIKWFVDEPLMAQARAILNAFRNGDLVIYVPDLMYAEIGNILWKKQRFQGLRPERAQAILETIMDTAFAVVPTATLFEDAYKIAVTHGRTMYDSLYVALGQREDCPFVTADEKLFNALLAAFPTVQWLGGWGVAA